MTKTHFNSLILFLSFFILQSFQDLSAQQISVSGKVKGIDPQSPPIVRLCLASDSSLIKAAISDSLGNFELEISKTGTFVVIIDQIDYQKYVSPGFQIDSTVSRIVLPDISVSAPVTALDDVVITVKKPFIERKIDRVVVNPDALVGSSGTTVLDLLEKAPGITVDLNGNISLKGKAGVQVFIDNKPTYMSQEDLAGYLRSLRQIWLLPLRS